MPPYKSVALTLAILGALALGRSMYHWLRSALNLRPDASRLAPFATWLRDKPEHYAPEGQRQLALRLRWQWIGLAFVAAALILNILAHRPT